MIHRVKVEYTLEVDDKSQEGAIREAAYAIPSKGTTNIKMECWTPKPKFSDEVGKVSEPRKEPVEVPPAAPECADDDELIPL